MPLESKKPQGGLAPSEVQRRDDVVPYPDESFDAPVVEGQRELRIQEGVQELEDWFGPTPEVAEEGSRELVGETSIDAAPVVSDIVRGLLTEVPRAVAYGTQEAVNETLQAGDELDQVFQDTFGETFTNATQLAINPASKAVDLTGQVMDFVMGDSTPEVEAEGEEEVEGEESEEEKSIDLVDAPETVTGNAISSMTQFAVGFIPVFKAIRGLNMARKLPAAVSTLMETEAAAAISSYFVFDPHEERLSNLIESFPSLSNVVTDTLQAKEEDSVLEGRAKNAIEGLGLGLGVEAVNFLARSTIKGVKFIRSNRESQGIPTDLSQPLDTSPLVTQLGDPNGPLFGPSTVGAAQVTEEGTGTIPELIGRGVKRKLPFKMNWAKFAETDDIQEVLKKTAKVFAKRIDKARRGKITDEKLAELTEQQLEGLAKDTGLTPEDIYRIQGSGFKAEEIMAMKWVLETATDDLISIAKQAEVSSDFADIAAFKRMKDIHAGVFAYTQGAVSEAGRALRASRLPTGSRAKQLSDLSAAVTEGGGEAELRRLAGAIAELDDPEFINKALRGSLRKRLGDAVASVWYFNLLNGIRTHIVNPTSSAMAFSWQTAERALAARIGQARGATDSVATGEASSMWYGLAQSFGAATSAAAHAARTNATTGGFTRARFSRPQAISAQNFPIGNFIRSATGGDSLTADTIDAGLNGLGFITTIPGRVIMAQDEFFQTVGRSAEIHALAIRDIRSKGLTGDEAATRYNELVENPETLMQESADAFARDITFSGQSEELVARGVGAFARIPLVGKLLIPFPRVTTNLPLWAFKRTPIGWLAKQVRADLAAGGARRDLALARMGMGSIFAMTIVDLTLKGRITGARPFDEELRTSWELENKEFSVKIGDTWHGYDRTDPVGLLMSSVASYTQLAGDLAPAERDQWANAIILATTESVLNKTWTLSLTQMLEAAQDPRRSFDPFLERTVGTLLVGTGVSQVRQAIDPVWREVNSLEEALRSRVPGYSETLPPYRNIWGEKMLSQFGFGDSDQDIVPESESMLDNILEFANSFMPFSKFTPPNEPINLWLFENRVGVKRPAKTQWGVELTPEQYSRFVELAGNGVKDTTGLGLKDTMNALIEGTHPRSGVWERQTDGPKGGRALMFRELMGAFREMARATLFEEDPEFRARVLAVAEEEATALETEIPLPRAGRAPR